MSNSHFPSVCGGFDHRSVTPIVAGSSPVAFVRSFVWFVLARSARIPGALLLQTSRETASLTADYKRRPLALPTLAASQPSRGGTRSNRPISARRIVISPPSAARRLTHQKFVEIDRSVEVLERILEPKTVSRTC